MRSTSVPEVHYARSGDISIAYQLVGDSPRDLGFVPTFSNLVYPWWNESFRNFYERLGTFARLILLDKRGTGLSDRPRDLGTLETRIDDIRALSAAVGFEHPLVQAVSNAGAPHNHADSDVTEATSAGVATESPHTSSEGRPPPGAHRSSS